MTKSWTDERLEERFDAIDQRFDGIDRRLDRVDQRLDRVDADIRDLRGEMNTRFDKVNADMKAGFDAIDERFAAMYRLMVRGGIAVIVAMIGLISASLGLFATQF